MAIRDGSRPAILARFPIGWNPLIEKESLGFKELEHAGIEKAGQLFRNMLYGPRFIHNLRRNPPVAKPDQV